MVSRNYFAGATFAACTLAVVLAEVVLFSSLSSNNVDWVQSATANTFGIVAGICVLGFTLNNKMTATIWALLSCVAAAFCGLAAFATMAIGMAIVVIAGAIFVLALIKFEDATDIRPAYKKKRKAIFPLFRRR
jgi:hypothetical protein